MARDHFVQQLLIRQFLNEKGRIFCFDKARPGIPDREHGSLPKHILFERGYYTDQLGNLDEELYKHVENAFAPHLLAMTRDLHSAVHRQGAVTALQEWVAAQLSRTKFVEHLVGVYARRFGQVDCLEALKSRDGFLNSMRVDIFHRELDEMKGISWRAYSADREERRQFVLSDEAVVKTPAQWATGTMYVVPISPTMIIAGGSEAGHRVLNDPSRNILPLGINGVAMSYSYRFAYSPQLRELESLLSMFTLSGLADHDEWMKYAKLPHFGLELMLDEASEEEIRASLASLPSSVVDEFLKNRNPKS